MTNAPEQAQMIILISRMQISHSREVKLFQGNCLISRLFCSGGEFWAPPMSDIIENAVPKGSKLTEF